MIMRNYEKFYIRNNAFGYLSYISLFFKVQWHSDIFHLKEIVGFKKFTKFPLQERYWEIY